MAKRKFEIISEMFDRVSLEVTSSPDNWRAFIASACRNFKLRYDEQILVYAQKPEATAVLEIERWNKTFGRWVNRGAKGIAVFEMLGGNSQRLVHYFDISDTHAGENSRPVPIWNMRSGYKEDVIDTLENTFGYLEQKDSLENAIISAADNAVEDNTPDYISDLLRTVDDSFLEGLGEIAVDHMYRQLVKNSVSYMLMTRLGINADLYFDDDDFRDIINFNTKATANAIGFATSDISEMGLSEIARTVTALARQNRIIAENRTTEYTKDGPNQERRFDNGRTDLHTAGRLSPARPDTSRTAEGGSGTLRSDEERLSEESPQDNLFQLSDKRNADGTSGGRSGGSDESGGNAAQADGSDGGHNRETEGRRSDEVDTPDEQPQTLGTGDSQGTGNIRISTDEQAQSTDEPAFQYDFYQSLSEDDKQRMMHGEPIRFDRRNEDKSINFLGKDEDIKAILLSTPHLKASLTEIAAYFETVRETDKQVEFLKSIFNNDFTEVIIPDGRRMGYKTFTNVLHLWEGSYLSRARQGYYDWGVIAGYFDGMRLLGELRETIKPLPSQEMQDSLIEEAAENTAPTFVFSQEIIDEVLTSRGSGVEQGKFRIYEQFQKSLSQKENISFLKNEYGLGGSYPVLTGTGIDEMHDGKGIKLSRGFGDDKPKLLLKWNQVEKRIRELIRLDRYLNHKEKAQYPAWLERQEQLRAERAAERAVREALYTPPTEKPQLEPTQYEYRYTLGATVYIGSGEYEILSFDENRVELFDKSFPLFNKEMTRDEFDKKVKENPMNDHLRVAIHPEKKKETVERDYSKYTPVMQEYFKIKDENPNAVVLFQIGDFYEAMGEDAQTVSQALDLHNTTRRLNDNESIDMCGMPSNRLETYVDMLLDRGNDVTVTSLENGKFVTRNLVSANKDDPIESKPVGRIEYLDKDGNISESIEYTSEYQFTKDIDEDSSFGVPFRFYVYRDADGTTIDQGFITKLKTPLNVYEIIDSPYLQMKKEEKKFEPLLSSFEKPKRAKAQTFDLHPDIPMADRHTFDLKSFELEEVGKKARYHRNVEAIRVLKQCEFDNRFATPEEQEILAQYVGWGGIPEAFDENNAAWSDEFTELDGLLSPEEYSSARESTLTAFYTPPVVISAVYKIMAQMGFQEGNILDKTTPRLIQFHTLKNAANPPFLGGFSIFGTVAA